jgi:hypothetical protein
MVVFEGRYSAARRQSVRLLEVLGAMLCRRRCVFLSLEYDVTMAAHVYDLGVFTVHPNAPIGVGSISS